MCTSRRRFFGDDYLHLGVDRGRIEKIPGKSWQRVGESSWTTDYDWSHPPGSILRKYPDRLVSSELRSKIMRKAILAMEAEKREEKAKKEKKKEGAKNKKKKKKKKKNNNKKRSAKAMEKKL